MSDTHGAATGKTMEQQEFEDACPWADNDDYEQMPNCPYCMAGTTPIHMAEHKLMCDVCDRVIDRPRKVKS